MAELSTDNMKLGNNLAGSYCFWERRFTLMLNAGKNTDYIKKCFEQKLLELNFYKKLSESISLSPSGMELGESKDCHFWNIMY